jgi:hypothetical protein
MSKQKPDHDTHATSQIDPHTGHDADQVAALTELANERGARIAELERERDQSRQHGHKPLGQVLGGIIGGNVRAGHVEAASVGDDITVRSVELISAPEHMLIVKLLGDHEALEKLRQSFAQAVVPLVDPSPSPPQYPPPAPPPPEPVAGPVQPPAFEPERDRHAR